ncbi:uncharacterized protein LOC125227417 [Leguminivora glycinivorella]|uniref:uncharacterized protein LOC125227417 n=1 Tax=Leguminivora glycinivorella TaxID=1035111 RepID=UPI00200C919B|nr:uncharacterized protein LOC125227417 [Leguminivora glycinivorella]
MSPLACSLFALATLFAVSDALPNPFCDRQSRGISGSGLEWREENFKLTVVNGVVQIPNKCKIYEELAGEDIAACNIPYSKPLLRNVLGRANDFGIVGIDCPSNTRGCMRLELNVTQYCRINIVRASE